MRLRIYTSLDELSRAYDSLYADGLGSSFFHSRPWFENFVQYALDPDDEIRIYCLEKEDAAATPVAALLTRRQRSPATQSSLRTLSSLSNYYTTRFEPLIDPASDCKGTLGELVRAICEERPRWDAINLQPMDREAAFFSELVSAFEKAGMVVQTYFCSGNWYYPVNGQSYKEYLETLRSSVRNIAKSKNRKIERSGRVRVEIVTSCDGLDSAISDYEKVYSSSWKVPEPYTLFVPGLMRRCAQAGWLRLGVAYVDNEPSATQFWVVHNGTASIYKIAYDRRFSELSVGTYLTMRMMEHAIDVDKVKEVDYLSGDDSYKRDWMSHRRELWGILALNPRTVRGALGIARHVCGRSLKRAGHTLLRGTRLIAAAIRTRWMPTGQNSAKDTGGREKGKR
jgi:Acetyltransferase (GNAT) domain